METMIVILVVSGSLLIGAAWGIYGKLPEQLEGFLVALAGGALIISAVLELIEPATKETNIWAAFGLVLAGALVLSAFDYLLNEKWGSKNSGGLLAAITLDGIPENLALGVALIGAGFLGEYFKLNGMALRSSLLFEKTCKPICLKHYSYSASMSESSLKQLALI